MKPILVRVDDYPTGNPKGELWHSFGDLYNAFDSVLLDYEIPYLLGVVPVYAERFGLPMGMLRDEVECAVHGFNHRAEHVPYNEFGGLSYTETQRRIREGFMTLSKLQPKVFIAPFNRYTQPLLDALKAQGCKYVTSGIETAEQPHLDWSGLTVIPSDFYGRSEEIMKRVDVGALDDSEVQVITLHWTWEVQGMVNGNGRLSDLCACIAGRVKPWSEVYEW